METEDLSILIVDDMQFSRKVMQSHLKKAGGYHDIRLAESANHALEMLSRRRSDVVLADWVMPEMSGLELTDAIRERDDASGHYTSVILFTGKEGEEAMIEAFKRGVDDYLTKPINQKELAARVYAAGRIAGLQNALLATSTALDVANQHLLETSTTDTLTGLGNRRFLVQQLEALLQMVRTRGGGLSLMLINVDDFADINEIHSYDTGDHVITAVARRLKETLRPTDVLVRTSGEEFATILHFQDTVGFKASVYDRVLQAINQHAIETQEGPISVTASAGTAIMRHGEDDISAEQIIERADQNLAAAKQRGKNQIVSD